ncbi:MAG TPA: glutamine amidotransferase [Longimicrobiales bacterium]|nr:glutamine amidotransferase [Longimicrobiales bacterium]
MDRLFEFLFKYRPLVFEQGDFAFTAPSSVRLWILAAGLAGILAVATYTVARGKAGRGERTAMAALRVALLAILVFSLLRPALILSTVVPQQNFLGILIDDSRSMQLPDQDGRPRSDFVAQAFTPGESALLEELADRFTLRFFRFSSATTRLDDLAELTYGGTHTHLSDALNAAREELAGIPLSGLVLVSDGAENGTRPLSETLVPLQAAGIPVFTVGLGEESVSPDIEVGQVELPRTILEGSTLLVDVVVTQTGLGQRTVPLIVEDAERILAEEEVTLGPDGEPVVVRVGFELDRNGPRRVRFRIPVQEGERVDRNNARDVQVEVRGSREKILYFEGEPRFEVKFMRRAVADDENLQLVVLQRTAESKFLRLDVDTGDELLGGFPRSREELYRYRALILGSVEASFFSHDQLQMIADFVSERGGALLMLGGRSAFAEGGWAGTPVEEVLPVFLDDPAGGPDGSLAEVRVAPTPAGSAHPALQLGQSLEDSGARWADLPPLTVVNQVTRTRPGATTLLTGSGVDVPTPQVILAHQRYGRGKALAFTAQDSWLWQMHADVPLEDQSHENFWQQVLRWMVDGVPDAVSAAVAREQVESGEPVRLVANVGDSTYIEVNDAEVVARTTSASGLVTEVPVTWTVERDGEYAVDLRPEEEGDYTVELTATRDGRVLGSDVTYLHVAPSDEEFFGAGRRTQLLERVARETGGQFYTPETVGSLADDISVTGAGVTLVEERDLWDMPVLFLGMLLLMGAEWGYRRQRGMP